MDEKVEIIQETMDIGKEEAELSLELAQGDLDKALRMIDYVDKNYIVIHGHLSYGGHNKTYGLFIIIANGKKGEFLKVDSVLSNNHMLSNLNLKVNTEAFDRTLEKVEQAEKKINRKIKTGLKNNFNPTEIFEILELMEINNQDSIRTMFQRKLDDILTERIELKLYTKLTTKAQLKSNYSSLFQENMKDEVESKDSKDKSKNKLGIDIQLDCIPIISPTKGKKVNQLSIGDKILVKIIDKRDVGKYLGELLQGKKGKAVGQIEEIEFSKATKRYAIVVQFGPDIYGKIVVEPAVKLAIVVEEEVFFEKEVNKKDKQDKIKVDQNKIVIGGLIIITVFLILIIMALFLQ